MEQGKPKSQMEAVGTPYPLITQALVRSALGRAREVLVALRLARTKPYWVGIFLPLTCSKSRCYTSIASFAKEVSFIDVPTCYLASVGANLFI